MERPVVTVVTPSYNQGRFIRATIESVLNQDYDRIEYIIMDGGSNDETASVVQEYAGRLRWISEKDRGQSHAINKGFAMAKGEVVAWLNSDDTFLPGAIRRAVAELEARPECGAVYGEGYLMDANSSVTGRFPCTQPFDLWRLAHLSDYILQQTVFFRRRVIDDLGYLDENLHYAMDWDLFIRIGKIYELGYIPEYMGCLREYPEAKSSAGGGPRIAEISRVMKRHTGKRLAPGYVIYGLETYRRIWCEWVRSKTPRALETLGLKLEQWIHDVACELIGRQIQYAQGWQRQGWIGRRAHLMAPAAARAFRVRGVNGGGARSLNVRVDGRVIPFAVAAGEFTLMIPLTPATGAARTITLETGDTDSLQICEAENIYRPAMAEHEQPLAIAGR